MPLILRRPAAVVPPPVLTPTLWVDAATGSDANSRAAVRAGGGSVKWATIGRAAWGSTNQASPNTAEAADAGDVVLVTAGTYSGPGKTSRLDPCFNPANSGTLTNRITFLASGVVTLQLSSGSGPTFGAYLRNYITWRGFTCLEANAPTESDTGVCVLWDCTGSWIEYCTINGNGNGHGAGDNHTGIRFDFAIDGVARNNTITNVTTAAVNPNNGAGIQLYASHNALIEHNEISSCGCGIFLKGGPTGGWSGVAPIVGHTVRYNYVHNCVSVGIAAFAGTPAAAATPTRIHQNIVVSCADGGLRFWHFNDAANSNDPQYTWFINNTVYNCGTSGGGLEFIGNCTYPVNNGAWNNIFSTQPNGIHSTNTTYHQDTTICDLEHNIYYNNSSTVVQLNDGSGPNLTLAQWQASPYFQDADAPAGSTSDPGFTAPGSNNFHIASGYALTQGRAIKGIGGADGTTIPAGCYITGAEVIGVEP